MSMAAWTASLEITDTLRNGFYDSGMVAPGFSVPEQCGTTVKRPRLMRRDDGPTRCRTRS